MNDPIFDIEALEQRAFERSKIWANLFDDILQREEGKGINQDDFEEIYKFDIENESNDDNGAAHAHLDDEAFEDNEEEVLEHITNNSRKVKSNATHSRHDLELILHGKGKHNENCEDEQDELQDLLNQTLPILVEHKRKWKKAGIERILNTFDAKKIEKKVGGWMRRNHSAYSDKSVCYKTPEVRSKQTQIAEDGSSEAESMHSVDTARYIRSSRKQQNSGHRSFSTYVTTTTIKTYRMVKSKRDELRDKYGGCPEYDDDETHREYRRLKQQKRLQKQRQISNGFFCPKKHLQVLSPVLQHSYTIQRRKQLRKRRSNSMNRHTSTSDEEDYDCHAGYSTSHITKLSRDDYLQNADRFNRTCQCQLASDKPDWHSYKQENERRCRSRSKLCRSVSHLASSSTDETDAYKPAAKGSFSEATRTASKEKKVPTRQPQILENVKQEPQQVLRKKVSSIVDTDEESVQSSRSKTANNPIKKKNSNVSNTSDEEIERKNKKKKTIKLSDINSDDGDDDVSTSKAAKTKHKQSKSKKPILSEEAFEADLKRALALSKESFDSENQQRNCKRETLKKQNNISICIPEQQTTLERSDVKTKNPKRRSNRQSVKSVSSEETKTKKPISSSIHFNSASSAKVTEPANNDTRITECKFFAKDSSKMCNSTAMVHDATAKGREFTCKPVRRAAAVSTTMATTTSSQQGSNSSTAVPPMAKQTNDDTLSVAVAAGIRKTYKKQKHAKNQARNDNDCAIVSSTTGGSLSEAQTKTTIMPTDVVQQASQTTTTTTTRTATATATQKKQINYNDMILLYKPHARHLTPSSSFYDGYFNITEEHLETVIGKSTAQKFLKSYLGRRRFKMTSTVYYLPRDSCKSTVAGSQVDTRHGTDTTSDSDCDVFDAVCYGDLYESLDECNN